MKKEKRNCKPYCRKILVLRFENYSYRLITSPVAAERYPAQMISTECAANSAFISLSTPFSTQSINALNSRCPSSPLPTSIHCCFGRIPISACVLLHIPIGSSGCGVGASNAGSAAKTSKRFPEASNVKVASVPTRWTFRMPPWA